MTAKTRNSMTVQASSSVASAGSSPSLRMSSSTGSARISSKQQQQSTISKTASSRRRDELLDTSTSSRGGETLDDDSHDHQHHLVHASAVVADENDNQPAPKRSSLPTKLDHTPTRRKNLDNNRIDNNHDDEADDLDDSEGGMHDLIFGGARRSSAPTSSSPYRPNPALPTFMVGQFPRIRRLDSNGQMVDMISDSEASERSARRSALRRTASQDGDMLLLGYNDNDNDDEDVSERSSSTRRRRRGAYRREQSSESLLSTPSRDSNNNRSPRRIQVPKLGRTLSAESFLGVSHNGKKPVLSPVRKGGKRPIGNVDQILHQQHHNSESTIHAANLPKNSPSTLSRPKQPAHKDKEDTKNHHPRTLRRTDGVVARSTPNPLLSSPRVTNVAVLSSSPRNIHKKQSRVSRIVDDYEDQLAGGRPRRSPSSERRLRSPDGGSSSGRSKFRQGWNNMGHQVKIPGRDENLGSNHSNNNSKSKHELLRKQSSLSKRDGSESSSTNRPTDSSTSTPKGSPFRKPRKLVLSVVAGPSPKPPMLDDVQHNRGEERRRSSAQQQQKELSARRRSSRKLHHDSRNNDDDDEDSLDIRDLSPSKQRNFKSPKTPSKRKSPRKKYANDSPRSSRRSIRSDETGKRSNSKTQTSRRSSRRSRTSADAAAETTTETSAIAALSIPNIGADSNHDSMGATSTLNANNSSRRRRSSNRPTTNQDNDDDDVSATELGASFVTENDLLHSSRENLVHNNDNRNIGEPAVTEVIVPGQSADQQQQQQQAPKVPFPDIGLPAVKELDLDGLNSIFSMGKSSEGVEPRPLYFAQQRISHRAGDGRNYHNNDDDNDTLQKYFCRGEDFDRRNYRRRPYPDVITGEFNHHSHAGDSLLYTCNSCHERMTCESGTIALRCPTCRMVLLPD